MSPSISYGNVDLDMGRTYGARLASGRQGPPCRWSACLARLAGWAVLGGAGLVGRAFRRGRTFPTWTYFSPVLLGVELRRMGEGYVHVGKVRWRSGAGRVRQGLAVVPAGAGPVVPMTG